MNATGCSSDRLIFHSHYYSEQRVNANKTNLKCEPHHIVLASPLDSLVIRADITVWQIHYVLENEQAWICVLVRVGLDINIWSTYPCHFDSGEDASDVSKAFATTIFRSIVLCKSEED